MLLHGYRRHTGCWTSYLSQRDGRIRGIDTSAAEAMPGVLAVFTGEDFTEACHSQQPECEYGRPVEGGRLPVELWFDVLKLDLL